MTIGEKIRFYRTKMGITQGTLAMLSEIHPVSIRKYETNKMQPQPEQLSRIATALNVSYTSLAGVSNNGLRLETKGDLMGLLMVLHDTGIIKISGIRGEDFLLDADSVEVSFNSDLGKYFALNASIDFDKILIDIKDSRIFDDFLLWEKMCYIYTMSVLGVDENDEVGMERLKEIIAAKELVELELQGWFEEI